MKVRTDKGVEDYKAVWMEGGAVRMIDQRVLPRDFRIVELRDHREVAESIRNMTVRGAPSIGAAAAYGIALAAVRGADLREAEMAIKCARPTANDLFYAVDCMLKEIGSGRNAIEAAEEYADRIVEKCASIGRHGSPLIRSGDAIMTHCNAGALASVDIGTALAPIRAASEEGKNIFVYVSETRPRLQGMKLTAWELRNEGIQHAIIVDGASGLFMKKGVDIVIVGADRIAANGDFANKIGTFEKAVVAKELGIPFYAAAPVSTFDFSIPTGMGIPIENRDESEVTEVDETRIAPVGCEAFNPAFDVTPAEYVKGFITEIGVLAPDQIHKMRGVVDVGD